MLLYVVHHESLFQFETNPDVNRIIELFNEAKNSSVMKIDTLVCLFFKIRKKKCCGLILDNTSRICMRITNCFDCYLLHFCSCRGTIDHVSLGYNRFVNYLQWASINYVVEPKFSVCILFSYIFDYKCILILTWVF